MKLILFLGFLLFAFPCLSQNRSNVWELSYSTELIYPNSEMTFTNGEADTQSV